MTLGDVTGFEAGDSILIEGAGQATAYLSLKAI